MADTQIQQSTGPMWLPNPLFRQLWALSTPIMLSALSATMMSFVDRIILAQYDTTALTAASTTGIMFILFSFATVSFASMSEIFVARAYGAKQYKALKDPVWAMIWSSVALIIPFIFIGLYLTPYLVPAVIYEQGVDYLTWLLMSIPFYPLATAVSAFFIGQGKVRVVTCSVIAGSFANLVLDIAFVFGVEGFIPEMGVRGAAIASMLAQMLVCVILMTLYLNKYNRHRFKTHVAKFQKKAFLDCFRVGWARCLGRLVSVGGWSLAIYLLSFESFEHITVYSILQSVFMCLTFISEGMQKGVCALVSLAIGRQDKQALPKIMTQAFIMAAMLSAIILVPFLIMPEKIVSMFIPEGTSEANLVVIRELLVTHSLWMWIPACMYMIEHLFTGWFVATKRTQFVMMASGFGTWVLLVLPIFLFIRVWHFGPIAIIYLTGIQGMAKATIFCLRYWRTRHLGSALTY